VSTADDLRATRIKLDAERAKREEAERERDDAISELCKAGESIGAERARSAALQAEVERMRKALIRFDQLVEAAQTSHADDGYTDADVQVGKFQDELPALLALAATDQSKER